MFLKIIYLNTYHTLRLQLALSYQCLLSYKLQQTFTYSHAVYFYRVEIKDVGNKGYNEQPQIPPLPVYIFHEFYISTIKTHLTKHIKQIRKYTKFRTSLPYQLPINTLGRVLLVKRAGPCCAIRQHFLKHRNSNSTQIACKTRCWWDKRSNREEIQNRRIGLPIVLLMWRDLTFCQFFFRRETRKFMPDDDHRSWV